MEHETDFSEGPILKPLLLFSLPILTAGQLFHIGLGIPCSTVAEILACFVFYFHIRRHELKKD